MAACCCAADELPEELLLELEDEPKEQPANVAADRATASATANFLFFLLWSKLKNDFIKNPSIHFHQSLHPALPAAEEGAVFCHMYSIAYFDCDFCHHGDKNRIDIPLKKRIRFL